MQQRAHPLRLQLFVHLPDAATRQRSKLRASPATLSLVSTCALLCALTCVCVGVLALTASAAPAGAPRVTARRCAGAKLLPTAANATRVDAATLCLVNRIRMAHKLRPLRANRELRHVAASQVASMVRTDYFADDRPTGQTPLALVSVTRYPVHAAEFAVGESIAWGIGSFTTPEHIVAEWMASPPHREIILSTVYHDAGVAVTPAVPAIFNASHRGATYAIELGMRLF